MQTVRIAVKKETTFEQDINSMPPLPTPEVTASFGQSVIQHHWLHGTWGGGGLEGACATLG